MVWLRRGILCILLLLSVLFALLFSHPGNVLLINLTKHFVPQLELELDSGTLLFSPQLSGVAWQDDQVDLLIENLSYRFDWGCLTKAICIRSLNVQGVDVNFHPLDVVDEEPAPSSGLPDTIKVPIDLRIEGVDISDVSYQQTGLAVHLTQFLFSAQITQQGATLSPTIDGLNVKLTPVPRDDAATPATASATDPETSSPLVLPSLKTPLPIYLPQVSLTGFTLEQGDKPFHLTSFYTSASWVDYDVTIEQFALVLPELKAELTATARLQEQWPVSTELAVTLLSDPVLDGQLVNQKVTLALSGDSQKVTSDLTLTGPVNLMLKGWVAPLSKDIDHQLALTWKKLQWPLVGESQFALNRGKISSAGNLDNFTVNIATLLHGKDIPDVELSSDIQGNLQQLTLKKLLAKTLSGEVSLTGKLDMATDIAWQGELGLKNIDSTAYFPDYPAQLNGLLAHEFILKGEHWKLAVDKLDLHGQFMEQPLKVSGKLLGNDKMEWNIDDLAIINGANKLTASGNIKEKVDLLLNLNVPDIASSVPNVKGNLKGKIKVQGELKAPNVNVNLSGANIAMGELSLASLNLTADAIASAQPSGNINLEVKQLVQPGVNVEALRLSASGSDKAHQVKLQVDGEPVASELSLSGRWQDQGWQGQLQQAWFETIEGRWQLQQPGQISYRNNQVTLGQQCWSSTPSLFCIQPTKAGESGTAGLVVEHYDLSRLQQFLPELVKLTGVIKTDVTAKWSKGAKPTANIDLRSEDINLTLLDENELAHVIPISTLTLVGELDKTIAKLVLNLDADQLGNADIDLALQPYTDENLLQGKVSYQGLNLKALHYLMPDMDELAGDVTVDLDIDGPLNQPVVKGIVQLKEGG